MLQRFCVGVTLTSLLGGTICMSARAGEIEPYHAKPTTRDIRPAPPATGEIQPGPAPAQVKLRAPAGVDVVAHPVPLDPRLVGLWAVSVPGVVYFTPLSETLDLQHLSAGAVAGALRIDADGSYYWAKKNQPTSKGTLVQVLPHNDADPKSTYWKLAFDRETFYLTCTEEDGLTIYSAGTNSPTYSAKRTGPGKSGPSSQPTSQPVF